LAVFWSSGARMDTIMISPQGSSRGKL
jgi:hypothetical protein